MVYGFRQKSDLEGFTSIKVVYLYEPSSAKVY